MASSSHLKSAHTSPGRDLPAEPTTPRHRPWRSGSHEEDSPQRPGDTSPSSVTASSGNLSRVFDSRSSLRNALQASASMNSINLATPARKLVVRSDPSLITCFDPADKELYDLWVPKR